MSRRSLRDRQGFAICARLRFRLLCCVELSNGCVQLRHNMPHLLKRRYSRKRASVARSATLTQRGLQVSDSVEKITSTPMDSCEPPRTGSREEKSTNSTPEAFPLDESCCITHVRI
jgi:hypothetical protein